MEDFINAFIGFFVDFFSALAEFLGGDTTVGGIGTLLGGILDLTK